MKHVHVYYTMLDINIMTENHVIAGRQQFTPITARRLPQLERDSATCSTTHPALSTKSNRMW